MDFSEYLIMCDVDGTLVDDNGQVPPRNREAILRYCQNGGRFAIASGRSRELVADLAEQFANFPCITYNGGVVYDFQAKKSVFERILPPQAKQYLIEFIRDFPDIRALVVTKNQYIAIHDADKALQEIFPHRPREFFAQCPLDEIQDTSWYKILLLVTPESEKTVYSAALERNYPEVRFVFSGNRILEMLPEHSSKGDALKSLMEQYSIKQEKLVAIGDYYNDLEMIQMAGIGATICTSPKYIQEQADFITGPHNNGAVADLIEHLERTYG